MSTAVITGLSLDEFLRIPETKPALEYGPEGVQQKVAPKTVHSLVQARVLTVLAGYGHGGRAFPELRVTAGGRSYVPDVAYFVAEHLPRNPDGTWIEDVTYLPDLVVEISSPGQSPRALAAKCQWYVAQGTGTRAWLVDPHQRRVRQWPAVLDVRGHVDPLLRGPGAMLVEPDKLFVDLDRPA
jgi:Uma2 family endonuclease